MAETGIARISLAAGSTPATRTAHAIRVRARTTSGSNGVIRVALYEGSTDRSGTLESAALTTSFSDQLIAIPDAVAATITSYSNLEIRLWGYQPSGTLLTFEVAEVALLTPLPAPSTTVFGSITTQRSFNFQTNGTIVGAGKSTGVAQISLAPAGDPGVHNGHIIKVRARTASGSGKLRVALYEGGVDRSGTLETATLTGSFATYSLTVPDANAANITSYSNLELRIWGVSSVTTTFDVASASLELPPGSATTVVTVGIATTSNTALPISAGEGALTLYPGTAIYPSDTLVSGIVLVGQPVEFSEADSLTTTGSATVVFVGFAQETSVAQPRQLPTPVAVGIASETSASLGIGVTGGATVIVVGIAAERALTGVTAGSGDLITREVIASGSDDLIIGARITGGVYSNFMDGVLDELALLGGAISAEEIRDLYQRVIHSGTDSVNYDSSTGIWAGASNLLPNGGFEGGITGWSAVSGATLSTETTDVLLGTQSLKITGSTGTGATTASVVTTVSQAYTGSVWVKGSGLVRLEIEERTAADAIVGTTTGSDIALEGTYQRISLSRSFGGTGAKARFRIIARSSSVTIYADGAQLEQGTLPTPYIETNGVVASRQAARVQMPGSYLDEAQGWVAARIRPGWTNTAEPGDAYVVDWRSTVNARISLFYEASSNSFVARRTDGASPAQASVARAITARDRVTVIAAWTSTGIKLSVDGAAFVSASGTGVPSLATLAVDLGSLGGSSNFLDGEFVWFACGKGTLTDADARRLYDWSDEPPRLHTYSAASLVQLSWDGVDEHALAAGYNHSLSKGQLRRIFHQPGAKRSSTELELIDPMERLNTETGVLPSAGSEFMGEAIARVISQIGIEDPSLQDLDSGQPGVTVLNDGTKTWLQVIVEIVLSDGGIFFIDGEGRAIYRERRSRAIAPYKGRLSRELHALAPGVDLDRIINTWAVEAAAAQVAEGDDFPTALVAYSRSYRRYGIRASGHTGIHIHTLDQAFALGEHMVRRTSEPDAPVYGISLNNRSDRLLAFCLGLEVGDLISVFGKKTIGYYIVEQIAVEADVEKGVHETSLIVSAL